MTALSTLRPALLALLGLCACKLEPLERVAPSDPARKEWAIKPYSVPDQRPQSEAARELASHMVRVYDALAGLEERAQLPNDKSPLIRYLTRSFGEASLAPDGDNRGWTQAVPLRRLQNKTWTMTLSLAAPQRGHRRRSAGVPTELAAQEVDQSSEDWAFRQFRDTGGDQETFSLLRLTPDLLENPRKLRQRARGKFVILDATQSDQATLRAQLLSTGSTWFTRLSEIGAVGCSVFTSLSDQDSLWQQLKSEFKRPFSELLAPGEAPPTRVELLAVANAKASRAWQTWHGGEIKALGPEKAGQGPVPKLLVSPLNAVDRRGQVVITMNGEARWETQYSVLGRQPGVLRPEKAIVVLARWNHSDVSETSAIQHTRNDAAITALLGLMRRTSQWHKQGRRTDISILYGALYGGQDAKNAGLAQFLRQKSIRPENIRAVLWLEDFSTRNDALDMEVKANRLPEGWPQLLELYGGHHMQISPPQPLGNADPLRSLDPLEVPVLTFSQAQWLDDSKGSVAATKPTFMPMAEQVEKILQFTWSLTEGQEDPGEDPDRAASGAKPAP